MDITFADCCYSQVEKQESLNPESLKVIHNSIAPPAVNPHLLHEPKIQYTYVLWPDAQKSLGDPNPQSNRKLAILIFAAILTHFHASYFNELLLQI